jgi:hypothetical protein
MHIFGLYSNFKVPTYIFIHIANVSGQTQEDYLSGSTSTISVSDSEDVSLPGRELLQASHRSKYS